MAEGERAMAADQLAWLAGLLEGEGCFYREGGRPAIAVNMTDRDVVERAAILAGGYRVSEKRAPSDLARRRRPSYRFRVTGPKAVALMRALHPYMGSRRREKIEELAFNG